ncbi:class I fructose-bisphosphate aldolase [Rickettsiales endosymbiont of Stachyamoeba lipophora]|uniref:class I fructose-bisphosphate aldolase n=1 Tax=Rickettsiales endosymbiont of Stachyamoeba lipophora TaxID=2486578 RepID=UPI000F64AE80|nr:class I fructose-bisphosphate aldolase [Rickettsiales endosymbiont of Stachyamoeba lipophora]AZL16180.1 class I fructose-bisphosphate aldolase [Rickettsiales endosymbiont of Stachyamoeba lipophora]
MRITKKVKQILDYYESDNPGTLANLCRILMHGKLGGTGKLIILPVDQGFEHGPDRSFAINAQAYDPHYHYKLAIDAGLSAYAAPLGMIEAGAKTFAGQIPLILKVNSSNSLMRKEAVPDQAITSSPKDAVRLGCSAIGFTIYPGSDASLDMISTIREMAEEAKSYGLAVIIWSYARGGDLTKDDETAIDVISYAAHIAALAGAHIIKVKPPTAHITQAEAKKVFEEIHDINISSLSQRIAHVKRACFNGRRIVVFSGGASKTMADVYNEARAINEGDGNGSIIGRNAFQRPREEALKMFTDLTNIYLGKM